MLTKTEEKFSNSPIILQRRSRSTGRGPFLNRGAVRQPVRDRSAESHVLYRACATDSHCLAAQLSFVGQECHRLPSVLPKLYGPRVISLDLSYNCLTTLAGVEQFPILEELILDNNQLPDNTTYPSLPNLHTLSLNKNCINNLDLLLTKVSHQLPSLRYLSLLGNKACPNQLSDKDKDEEDYQRYRYYVIHHLPKLHFLDSRQVNDVERQEAQQRGQFMRIMRPSNTTRTEEETSTQHSIYSPLPNSGRDGGDHQGAYGRCRYRYSGKHSEGNRFIQNSDL
ncbi:leucine-rich melanocyte differentiation-associated protein isoform X2 [Frankliniella occidentalis]|uniref:Leucine-rich melanocyte differentiation-associated protein isoform X2 n=1 Tax=Frankliniella occidentalis TaxID=133901 RepID=A0A9C6X0A2_FRAOC|nr:leucine-rich melanocyte differentiation-associated protein isoform X2 [Frankliniella occidentalis]